MPAIVHGMPLVVEFAPLVHGPYQLGMKLLLPEAHALARLPNRCTKPRDDAPVAVWKLVAQGRWSGRLGHILARVGRHDATAFRVGELFGRLPRVGPSPLCPRTGRPWAGLPNPFRIAQGVRNLVRPALRGALRGKETGTGQSILPVVVYRFGSTPPIVLSGAFWALRASECNGWPRG